MFIPCALNSPAIIGGGSFNINFMDGAFPADIMNFTRASSATYFDATGTMQTVGTDVPRQDNSPATLQPRGLLVEGARTNLVTYSADIANTLGWSVSAATATANQATAPDGTNTAGLLTDSGGAAVHYAFNGNKTIASTTTYTYSQFFKASSETVVQLTFTTAQFASAYANFDLINGTIVTSGAVITAGMQQCPNGWWRCWIAQTSNGSGTGNGAFFQFTNNNINATRSVSYTANGRALYAWGGQFEVGSFPSSYIPTLSSSATRALDSARASSLSSIGFNASEGTVVAEFMTPYAEPIPGIQRVCQFHDGSASNRIYINASSNGIITAGVNTGGAAVAITSGWPAAAPFTVYKVALAYKENDFAFCLNGGVVQTDTSGAVPSVNALQIGNNGFDTTAPLNGWVRRVSIFPKRLDNDTLQQLTS